MNIRFPEYDEDKNGSASVYRISPSASAAFFLK